MKVLRRWNRLPREVTDYTPLEVFRIASPFQTHAHPVQHSPHTRFFSSSAGCGLPPVVEKKSRFPSTSNGCKNPAKASPGEQTKTVSLPRINSQGCGNPQGLSGESALLQPLHQLFPCTSSTNGLISQQFYDWIAAYLVEGCLDPA